MTDQDALLQRRIFNWSQGLPDWQRGLMRVLCDGPLDEAGRAGVLAVLCGEAGSETAAAAAAGEPAGRRG